MVAIFDKVPHGLLETAIFGEPSDVPAPKPSRIEFRNLVDGQELSRMVIARMVTMFVESTKHGRARRPHLSAELVKRQDPRRAKCLYDVEFLSWANHVSTLLSEYTGTGSQIT